jgi:hypothetical protein
MADSQKVATMEIVTYGCLTKVNGGRGPFVQVAEPELHHILRSALPRVEVDEEWYRQYYGDVGEAIEQGHLASAREHYIAVGYFEGRFPRQIAVDEKWYLSTYTDVADAIRKGKFTSAQDHFEIAGYKEGRMAHADWKL